MNKFFSKLISPLEIIKIIYRYQPLYLLYAFPQIIIKAILPFLYIYFPKTIIEQIISPLNDYNKIIYTILIFGSILLFLNIIDGFLKNKSDYYSIVFSKRIKNKIGKTTMMLALEDVESTELQNTIFMANEAVELTKSMSLIQSIISNMITIVGVSYIVFKLDFIVVIILIVTLSFKILTEYLKFNYSKKIRVLQSSNSRYLEYLFNISYFSEGGAKEIRLNSLQDWYMKKNEVCRGEMVRLHFKSFKMAAFINIIIQLLVAIQSIIILVLLSRKFVIGDISLAEFTMYFSAITTLTVYLSLITEHLSNYNQQILGVSDYKKITNLISKDENILNKGQQQKLLTNGIEINFENISFAYPNTNTLILKKINLKISNKEKLLIVGMNGSGKSTLIKLLCKFYHPTSGKILINGVDIWSIPNQDYYKIISSVFQDYANFAFSIKENISMSEKSEEIKITKIIEDVGLKARIEALPKGYDTFLSRKFDTSGIELSGGQAQKLAIARAIYKDASILILDEPTANLDPKAESEIYEDFFNMSKGKTTIFISHRLAASKLADNIAVFSKGEIVEYGPHDTLISKNGVYAEMYRKQSEQYISKEKIF